MNSDIIKKDKTSNKPSEKKAKVRDISSNALEEVTLIKDHGVDKKGDVLKRHPNTCDMLISKKIAK